MLHRNIPIDDADERGQKNGGQAEAGQIEQLEGRIAELTQENQQLKDQTLRSLAELENFRRRTQQEREQIVLYGNERLLRELLPILDDFQRSVEAGAQTKDFDNFYTGISMIRDKVRRTLEAQGVKRMEVIGQPFDVNFHEALLRQPSDAPEDTVIGELEPGYMYGDRVLRHAKVIISDGSN